MDSVQSKRGERGGATRVSRRQLLTWLSRGSLAAAGAVIVGQIIRFLSFEPPDSGSTVFAIGRPADYPLSAPTYIAEARCYVARDRTGMYVVDAVCPHLGCLVEPGDESGFVCPCHDSQFDGQGNAVTGPATKPLRHLHLWYDAEAGQLTVDRGEAVDPVMRLAL